MYYGRKEGEDLSRSLEILPQVGIISILYMQNACNNWNIFSNDEYFVAPLYVSEILWERERERESIEIDLGKSTGMIFCDSDYHIVQADSANNY